MNILMTVSTYFPKEDGVSMVTQYLAEGLAQNGHNVTVITELCDGYSFSEERNSVTIKRVDMHTRFGLYFGDKISYRKLVDNEVSGADVMINVCTQNAFTDVILKTIEKYRCKKVLYMHGMFDFRFRRSDFTSLHSTINKLWKEVRWFFYYACNGKYFKEYDSVIQLHEEDYGNRFFERKYGIKSTIIGNAVDDKFFDSSGLKGFKKPFDKYLIYVANYDNRKNQKLAISQFLKADIDLNIGLVLIGSDKNKYYYNLVDYLKKKRRRLGFSSSRKSVLLLYSVDRNLIPAYVKNADLYLMTSRWEALPISILESVASGVPFVCTDVGIVKYFPGGVVTNKQGFSGWIKFLVENDDIRECYSEIALRYAKKNLTIENKVKILEDELRRIVGGRKVGN